MLQQADITFKANGGFINVFAIEGLHLEMIPIVCWLGYINMRICINLKFNNIMYSLDCVLIEGRVCTQFIFVFSQNALHNAWHVLWYIYICYQFFPANGTRWNTNCDSRIILLLLCISPIDDCSFAYTNIYATKWENDLHVVILLPNLSCSLLWERHITKSSKKDKSHSTENGSLGLERGAQAGMNWLPCESSTSWGSLFPCGWRWGAPPHIEVEASESFGG